MKAIVFPTVLSAVALATSALTYFRLTGIERDLGSSRADDRPAGTSAPSYAAEEEGPGWARDGAWPEAGREDGGATVGEAGARTSGVVPAARESEAMEEKIARLERQVETLRATSPASWRGPRAFARTVDDLSSRLSLTPTQQARVADAVERGRRRIDDILRIPDETGKSPHERREEARKRIEEAAKSGSPGSFLAVTSDLISHVDRRIPGRNETYGQEIDRVRRETRQEIAASLDSKQKESFEETNIDEMLGGGGQMAFAFSMAGPAREGEAEGAVMIEVETAVATEEVAPEPLPPSESGGR